MRPHPTRRAAIPFLAFLAATVAACDRNVTDPHDDHDEFHRVEVIDRGQATLPVVAVWESGEGWTGALPPVSLSSENQRISLGFRVFSDDGDELELSEDDESIRYALASGAPQGILDMSRADEVLFHGDHVHIYGLAPGTTRIRFILWHIDHADDATDPIEISVVN